MSRYIMIRRLRGPAFLMLIGIVALFHQMGILDHPWHFFWPLFLILLGVFMLAERAAMAAEGGYPPAPYPPGQPYPGAPYAGTVDPNAAPAAQQYTEPESAAIVPVPLHDLTTQDQNPEGGQS